MRAAAPPATLGTWTTRRTRPGARLSLARVVFSIMTLLDVFSRARALSTGSERAWYWSAQSVLMCLLGVAALVLLFTGPANAWFRTRGGRVEAP